MELHQWIAMTLIIKILTVLTIQSVFARPQQANGGSNQICTDYECFARLRNANQLDAVSKTICEFLMIFF